MIQLKAFLEVYHIIMNNDYIIDLLLNAVLIEERILLYDDEVKDCETTCIQGWYTVFIRVLLTNQ